LNTSYKYMNH